MKKTLLVILAGFGLILTPMTAKASLFTTEDSSKTMASELQRVPENTSESDTPQVEARTELLITEESVTVGDTIELQIALLGESKQLTLNMPEDYVLDETQFKQRNQQAAVKQINTGDLKEQTWQIELMEATETLFINGTFSKEGLKKIKVATGKNVSEGEVTVKTLVEKPQPLGEIVEPKMPKLGPIDFSILDAPGERDGAVSQSINTPVKIRSSSSDPRSYYMFFGGVNEHDTAKSFKERIQSTASNKSAVGKPINKVALVNPSIVAVPDDDNQKVIGYMHDYKNTGEVGGFDVGVLTADAKKIESTLFSRSASLRPSEITGIAELYVNEETQTIFAYGTLIINNTFYPARVKGTTTKDNRVSFSLKIYNDTDKTVYLLPTYGTHTDIQGRGNRSAMYSQGDKKGVYFKHDGTPGSELLDDGSPYYLYFYRKAHHQINQGSFPTYFLSSQNAAFTINQTILKDTIYPTEEPDLPADSKYNLQNPGWLFRWQHQFIMPKRAGTEATMEVSVSDFPPNEAFVTVSYVDEEGNEIAPKKNYQVPSGTTAYTESAIKINGYRLATGEALEQTGTVEPGERAELVFRYDTHQFDIKQKVSHLDGSSGDQVSRGEHVAYAVAITSQLETEQPLQYYKNFTINNPLANFLEDVTNLSLVDGKGNKVGTARYDSATHQVIGELKAADQVTSNQNLVLSYQAKVKDNTPIGTIIKSRSSAEGHYTGSKELVAKKQQSNEVSSTVREGTITFSEAPVTLNFGRVHEISSFDRIYPLLEKEQGLIVKDERTVGQTWKMTAKMSKLLSKPQNTLGEAMYYKRNGVLQLMTLGDSALVHEQVTTSNAAVDISQQWQGQDNGPVIQVSAGQALKGDYQGTIEWTLENVPPSD